MPLIQLLERTHDQSLEWLHAARVTTRYEFSIAAVYVRQIELSGSFQVLAEAHRWTGALSMLRPILDNYADVINLANDADYFDWMASASTDQWIRMLNIARREPDNPYYHDLLAIDQEQGLLERFRAELDALAERGMIPLSAEDKFRRAGLANEYALFRRLSQDVHGGLSAVWHNQFERLQQQIAVYRQRDPQEIATYTDTAIGCLICATEAVSHHLRYTQVDWLHQLQGEREQLLQAELDQ